MGAFLHVIRDEDIPVKACGRACPDMEPSSRPILPPSPPLSLLALQRERSELVFPPEWLEAMETSETIH
ncbi:MAG: hypothetical protein JSW09_10615 [Pseudomonadota bacterium]|nr:MAG: hypothetical protein JSW09_10615 [Pseudomonadota bacterium]